MFSRITKTKKNLSCIIKSNQLKTTLRFKIKNNYLKPPFYESHATLANNENDNILTTNLCLPHEFFRHLLLQQLAVLFGFPGQKQAV